MATKTETTTTTTATDAITLSVKVKSARLFENEFESNVTFKFDKEFEGIIKDDTGNFVEGVTNRVVMPIKKLIYLLSEADEQFALFIGCAGRLNQAAIALLLTGAKMTIVRKFFAAGEILEGNDTPQEHDGYSTTIVDVAFTSIASDMMSAAIADILPSLMRR